MSAPQSAAARPGVTPAPHMSGRERVGLFIGRGLDKWLTPLGVWLYRRTKGGITRPWKVNALLLTTRGRRTGRRRTVVLQFFPDGQAMILAAANDGGSSHPAAVPQPDGGAAATSRSWARPRARSRTTPCRRVRQWIGGGKSSTELRVTSDMREPQAARSRSFASFPFASSERRPRRLSDLPDEGRSPGRTGPSWRARCSWRALWRSPYSRSACVRRCSPCRRSSLASGVESSSAGIWSAG